MLDAFNSLAEEQWPQRKVQGTVRPSVRSALRDGPAWSRVVASEEQLTGLSRPEFAFRSLPVRPEVYQGVRFQTDADKGKDEKGQTGQTSSGTFSYARTEESFQRVCPVCPPSLKPTPRRTPTATPNPPATATAAPNCSTQPSGSVAPEAPATSTKKRHHHDTPATPSQQPTTPEPTPKQSSRPRTSDSPQPFSVTVEA